MSVVVQFVPRPHTAAAPLALDRRPPQIVKISDGSTSQRVANSRGECEERKRRCDRWRAIDSRMTFNVRMHDLFLVGERAFEAGVKEAKPFIDPELKNFHRWGNAYREAFRDLMLLPAPTANKLNWKKTQRASGFIGGADPDEVDRQIAADVEWLKANAPVRRKAVRS